MSTNVDTKSNNSRASYTTATFEIKDVYKKLFVKKIYKGQKDNLVYMRELPYMWKMPNLRFGVCAF